MASSHTPTDEEPIMDAAAGVRQAKINPSFLHTNSTSHTWVFGAIAELIDNASDAEAEELRIDYEKIGETSVLKFHDDGKGMNKDELYSMLSFGFSCPACNRKSIGQYGNGFKSGSMRLGKDAMVFTKSEKTMSVGFLSQTYLDEIKADTILVPIVTWDMNTQTIIDSADSNLEALTTHSILFKTEEDFLDKFRAFKKGTLIFIYNLKRQKEQLELDFEKDPKDILVCCDQDQDTSRHLLREYCSILYLQPRMKIILRSEDVEAKHFLKHLQHIQNYKYKPQWLTSSDNHMNIQFRNEESKNNSRIRMYYRNRLIKTVEKVNSEAIGVVGVVECDNLHPSHNKQDFTNKNHVDALISAAKRNLKTFWDGEKPTNGNKSSGGDDKKEICEQEENKNLKEENKNLKEENKNLKEENIKLKEENKNLKEENMKLKDNSKQEE